MASPQPSTGTFVTGVDAGGVASPVAKQSSSPGRGSTSGHHGTVRRIEDEAFAFAPGTLPQPLPGMVSYRIIVDDILDTVVDIEDRQSQARVAVKRTERRF